MFIVLLPYRFTLLSNIVVLFIVISIVLLPYRFTLLSNGKEEIICYNSVLLPYRFTLLSNLNVCIEVLFKFYYPIDLHYSQTGAE